MSDHHDPLTGATARRLPRREALKLIGATAGGIGSAATLGTRPVAAQPSGTAIAPSHATRRRTRMEIRPKHPSTS